MANDNSFSSNVESLFKGLDGFLTTKTVIGEAVHVGDQIMIPLADVSFGLGAGAFTGKEKNNGGGGMGAKVSPTAVLMIDRDGNTKLVTLKNQDTLSRIIDMAPGLISKFMGNKKDETPAADEDFEDEG